jgi:hypothetical protein
LLAKRLIAPVNALGYPVVRLSEAEAESLRQGGEIPAPDSPVTPGTLLAALEPGGGLLAIVEARPGRRLQPVRVLRSASGRG